MRYIVIFILVCFLGSCGSKKKTVISDTKETITDSTYTTKKIITKDTLLTVAADSLKLSIPIDELSEAPIIESTGRTTARVSLVDDNLQVECLTEEYEAIIELQKEVITSLREIIKTKETNTEVTIVKTPWYMKLRNLIGGIALLLIIGLVVKKYLKPF